MVLEWKTLCVVYCVDLQVSLYKQSLNLISIISREMLSSLFMLIYTFWVYKYYLLCWKKYVFKLADNNSLHK